MLNRKNDNAVNLKMLKKTSADFEVGCCTTNSTIAQRHQSVMNKNGSGETSLGDHKAAWNRG